MASRNETSPNTFTFLNYNNPTHSASHRRAVKSHISSKYRAAVRQQAHPRYALPHRDLRLEGPGGDGEEDAHPMDKHEWKSPSTSPTCDRQSTPSPLNIGFSGTRIDPFGSFPGQQTPCVVGALDYYIRVLSPLHQPLLVAVNLVNPMMSWGFPVIMSYESAFHGAIALSQAYLEKGRDATARPSQEVCFHRYKAVAILRDRLSNLQGPPDDGTLLAVLALASLDVIFKEDNISNRKGLALMVAMKGGLDKLGLRGLVKAYLIQFDYFWMLETQTESIFPLAKRKEQRLYPEHPFQEPVVSIIATLPSGFAAIARQGSLGVDVLRILSRVSTFMHAKTSKLPLAIDKDPVPEDEDYPDIFDACSCLHSAALTEHSLEKNICLAIILFSFSIHSQTDYHAKITPYRGSRQELTRSLPLTPHRGLDERACLIWIWMVVISSWRINAAMSHEGLSLSRQFCTKFGEARSWISIETAMRRFFWYEPLREVWKTTWREALDEYETMNRRDTVHPTGPQPMGTRSFPVTFLPARQIPWESTPTLNSRRETEGKGRSNSLEIQARTGHQHAGQVVNGSEDTAVASPYPVLLPPMLTLETYLGQMQ